jgi:zinc/manganese transport system substrate-binding protein/manganese/iron transport system substrate-binding protein
MRKDRPWTSVTDSGAATGGIVPWRGHGALASVTSGSATASWSQPGLGLGMILGMVPNRIRIGRGVGAVIVLGLLAAGCGSGGSPATGTSAGATTASATKVHIVVTTPVLADFARNVGGDGVDVYSVLKPNVDPHDYEPTPADLEAIADADVVVKNGVGLEKWFEDTIASAEPKGAVVDASTGVTLRHGDGGEADPHIWQDPRNAEVMVANVAHALEAAAPSQAADFEQRAAAYTAKLVTLDADVATQLATLSNKKLVTNHDAFGYYVDHYGLDFVGSVVPSFDSQAELSQQDINDLVAAVKAQGVKAIFSESSLPPKTAEAIGKEAGVKVVEGDGALYGDSLGPDGSGAATYIDMVEHNTKVIVDNLR